MFVVKVRPVFLELRHSQNSELEIDQGFHSGICMVLMFDSDIFYSGATRRDRDENKEGRLGKWRRYIPEMTTESIECICATERTINER